MENKRADFQCECGIFMNVKDNGQSAIKIRCPHCEKVVEAKRFVKSKETVVEKHNG